LSFGQKNLYLKYGISNSSITCLGKRRGRPLREESEPYAEGK